MPKGVTHKDAVQFYGDITDTWEDDDPRVDYWDMFVTVWDEAQDKEIREECCLERKPAIGKLRAAFDRAAKDAESVIDLDLYTVADYFD